jgi:hypothetical protein
MPASTAIFTPRALWTLSSFGTAASAESRLARLQQVLQSLLEDHFAVIASGHDFNSQHTLVGSYSQIIEAPQVIWPFGQAGWSPNSQSRRTHDASDTLKLQ